MREAAASRNGSGCGVGELLGYWVGNISIARPETHDITTVSGVFGFHQKIGLRYRAPRPQFLNDLARLILAPVLRCFFSRVGRRSVKT